MTALTSPLRSVVGDKTAKVLADGLDLHTVGDLLHHYPRRYAERGSLTDLADLQVDEHVTVLARVETTSVRPMRDKRKRMLEVSVGDGHRRLKLTWFNQAWREKELRVGRQALFAGKVGEFKGKLQLVNPDYQLIDDDSDELIDEFAGRLIPVYPATVKLPSWSIAKAIRVLLDTVGDVDDPMPDQLLDRRDLITLDAAIRGIHRPTSWEEVEAARRRLKWDEAFLLQVTLAQRRAAARATPSPPRVRRTGGLLDAFDERLPFTLTGGQREVAVAVDAELAREHPMQRLLQGEVGSGKTVVALRAMLTVVDAGGQAALMAPTEVLATQHARSIRELLGPVGRAGELDAGEQATRVVLLTGSLSAAARRDALAAIASGEAGIVIGTHALIYGDVEFRDLGLVVVDEQHRFGVEQRDLLRAKGASAPHVLVMTATPIPRTVAMTVYGDLETSTLRELPQGRLPIRTVVVPRQDARWWARVWERVQQEVAAGHQAFVVVPKIAASETDDTADEAVPEDEAKRPLASVEDFFPEVRDELLTGLRVEALHGRMHPDDKDAIMRRFARGDTDVLVSTTVVEVGVDVPNATVMVVMDADRFGISQLHQLRGRVGRGGDEAYCLLVTESPSDAPGYARLQAVEATGDGFELARVDLEQRREGDVLGTAQAGRRSGLRLLELLRDEGLILDAREEATAIVDRDPTLTGHPLLAAAVTEALDAERAEYLEKG